MEAESDSVVTNKKVQAGVALVALIAVVAGSAFIFRPKPTVANASAPATTTSSTTSDGMTPAQMANMSSSTPASTTTSASPYKDGTYTKTGSYNSPAGNESIKVTLTLANGVVTDSSVVSLANDPTAASYQNYFISGYKSLVTGKNIKSIKLSSVSGSSLTSQGFNSAVKQIEAQASA